MLRKCFSMLAETSPKMAFNFLSCVEGMQSYNNFVTEAEAVGITDKFMNADGSAGAKWSMEEIADFVDSIGGEVEQEPYFNRFALYVTMNMEHSDHSRVINKWSEGDASKYAEMCYDLAVSQLKDKDKPHWIREYFSL